MKSKISVETNYDSPTPKAPIRTLLAALFLTFVTQHLSHGQKPLILPVNNTTQFITIAFDAFSGCNNPSFTISDSVGTTALQNQFATLSKHVIDSSMIQSAKLRCNQGLGNRGLILIGIGPQPPIWSSFLPTLRICGNLLQYQTMTGMQYISDTGKTLEKLVIKLGVERDLHSNPLQGCGEQSFIDLAKLLYGWQPPSPAWRQVVTFPMSGQHCAIEDLHVASIPTATTGNQVYLAAGACGLWTAVEPPASSKPQSLQPVKGLLENKSVTSVIANGTAVIAGTSKNGIFRSTDGGKSWLSFSNGILNPNGNQSYESILQLLEEDGKIYALTKTTGVYSTSFTGTGWMPLGPPNTKYYLSALAVKDGELMVTDITGMIKKTSGHGNQWQDLPPIILSSPKPQPGPLAITELIWNEHGLFAAIPNDCMKCSNPHAINGTLFRSLDDGVTLKPIVSPVFNRPSLSLAHTGQHLLLAINNTPSSIAAKWTMGAYFSNNNGDSWTRINNSLGRPIRMVRYFHPTVYGITDSGSVVVMHKDELNQYSTGLPPKQQRPSVFKDIRPVFADGTIRLNLNRILEGSLSVYLYTLQGQKIPVTPQINHALGAITLPARLAPGYYRLLISTGKIKHSLPVFISQ